MSGRGEKWKLALQHITRIETETGLIRRVRADNPSPLTGTGTNTYVLGRGSVCVVDPGPDLPSHLMEILNILEPDEHISSILVTHSHLDHSALVPRLKQVTGASVYAFGDSRAGRSPHLEGLSGLGGGEGVDTGFSPDHVIGDEQDVLLGEVSVRSYWTPGHFGNHLCFEWGHTLFTGDLVMGWATSLVSPPDGDLTAFMASLDKLRAKTHDLYLPGHGEAISTPADRVEELTSHRRMREGQILDRLAEGPQTAAELTASIYTDVPQHLHPAATRNVLAHLIDLAQKNQATHEGELGQDSIFSLS
jgi:glyoxylase-like metal-dependent hydrolase (beta-lactamase superfamily II)